MTNRVTPIDDNNNIRNQRKVKIMKLEKFNQAIEGQKTIRLTHKMARGDGYVTVNREVEVSDLSVGESGLIRYTCYMAGVCRHVLTRVS